MERKKVIRKKRKRANPLALCFLIVSAMLLSSALLALVWQFFMPALPEENKVVSDERLLAGPLKVVADNDEMPVIPPAPVSLPMKDENGNERNPDRVRSDYFDDAVFVGDSITTGISLYDIMSNARVYAKTGLGVAGILDNPFVEMNGENVTLSEAFRCAPPGKIYVMLGGNSIGNYDGKLIEPFTKFIETIAEENPNAIIYIQSVLPVNEAKYKEKYHKEIKNEWIDDYNSKLKELSEKNGYYYLDVASVFKDESGGMPAEYTRDGVHIGVEQYSMWFDYLKENTAENKKD